MTRRSSLRASDSDRERIVERLRQATVEGRLAAEEMEERLGAAFAARTYGELDGLVADLPRERAVQPSPRFSVSRLTPARALALLAAGGAALVVMATLAIVLTLLLGVWMVWAMTMWWLFGRRPHARRVYRVARRYGYAYRGYGRAHRRYARTTYR